MLACDAEPFDALPTKAPGDARFAPRPESIRDDKALRATTRALRDHFYANERLELYRCRKPRMESEPGESQDAFMVRLQDTLDEAKETALEKLQERYGKKETRLQDQLKRAQERVAKEEADSNSTLIDVGISVLGALFGRRSATSIGRTISKSTRAYKERGQLTRAQERVAEVEEKIHDLEIEFEEKIEELSDAYTLENHPTEAFTIKPRKSDIQIKHIAIVWEA
jgi:flagellar motility protein MotE (MotC chaperone)